jgi:hypothetical protein
MALRVFANSSSFLPESPRYLISKDRENEAFEILVSVPSNYQLSIATCAFFLSSSQLTSVLNHDDE